MQINIFDVPEKSLWIMLRVINCVKEISFIRYLQNKTLIKERRSHLKASSSFETCFLDLLQKFRSKTSWSPIRTRHLQRSWAFRIGVRFISIWLNISPKIVRTKTLCRVTLFAKKILQWVRRIPFLSDFYETF